MNRSRFSLLSVGVALILLAVSCGSAPPPEQPAAPAPVPEKPAPVPETAPPPKPEPAPETAPPAPDKESPAALDNLLARVETARNDARTFDGPLYFEAETTAAENAYTQTKDKAKTDTAEQVEDAITQYTRVAETFEKILADSLPLYARDRTDEIIAAREAAVNEGAPALMPERSLSADQAAEEARRLYEDEGDYHSAAAAVPAIIARYSALALGIRAYKTRERIKFYNFERYDPDNFIRTDDLALGAINAYDGGSFDTARDAARTCLARYTGILNAGMKTHAVERRAAADTGRRTSVQNKAPVAVIDGFASAQNIFDTAEKLFHDGQYHDEQYIEAAELYSQAESAFAEVTAKAEQKRLLAEDAIRRAEESVTASENTARTAEGL
jgi:hypothetical protein